MSRVETMLAEARDDVRHADQKASLLLAALGVGYGAVLAGQLSGDWAAVERLTPCGNVVWWVGVALAAGAVLACSVAVWPRYRVQDRPQYGITYWGHISGFRSLEAFESALDAESASKDRRARHQLWRLSVLVWTKYRFVRLALILGGAAACFLSIAVIAFGK